MNPDAVVEDLPVGVQQRVEIIKALSRDAQVLVLDEPTAVLTPQETDELMEIMRQLKAAGKAIVFITHKLREVREVADKITVIRLGKVVGEASPTASNAELAALMVGRPVELTVHKDAPKLGDDALVVEGLSVIDDLGRVHVDDVSFSIKAGEILAVAGVQGNGQTELTEALLGLQDHVRGSIRLGGAELVGRSVRQILAAGVGFVPEDRQDRRAGRRLHHRREPDAQPQLRRAVRQPRVPAAGPSSMPSRRRSSRSTTSARPASPRWPGSSRAATSRRWSWPASCPAT